MEIIIDDDGVMHKVYTKTDLVAMLTEIQLEIEELKNEPACCKHFVRGIRRSSEVVQQKINSLKENKDESMR